MSSPGKTRGCKDWKTQKKIEIQRLAATTMTAPPLRAPSGKKVRKKKPRNKPILEPDAQETLQGSALIRALASPDNSTRKKGLDLLTSWLESHKDISEHDVARLWKALYFCFWHSDLITVQVRLHGKIPGHFAGFSLPRTAYVCRNVNSNSCNPLALCRLRWPSVSRSSSSTSPLGSRCPSSRASCRR